VLAVAVVAGDANRPARAVHDNDCVETIGLARTAVIFERLACPEGAIHDRYRASVAGVSRNGWRVNVTPLHIIIHSSFGSSSEVRFRLRKRR
jgi:hypothetical protein